MVSPSVGATIQVRQDQLDQVTDSLNKKLNFKETKENSGVLEAKGKDGKRYVADGTNALYTITAIEELDDVELKKRNPGTPLPKDRAKKAEDAIKEEKKQAKENRKKEREEAVKNGRMTKAQAEAQDKAEEDDDEPAESPEAASFSKRSQAPDEGPPGRKAR
jgi:hypothetical protein